MTRWDRKVSQEERLNLHLGRLVRQVRNSFSARTKSLGDERIRKSAQFESHQGFMARFLIFVQRASRKGCVRYSMNEFVRRCSSIRASFFQIAGLAEVAAGAIAMGGRSEYAG